MHLQQMEAQRRGHEEPSFTAAAPVGQVEALAWASRGAQAEPGRHRTCAARNARGVLASHAFVLLGHATKALAIRQHRSCDLLGDALTLLLKSAVAASREAREACTAAPRPAERGPAGP